MTMQIGELATYIGVSARSLRHYEHQGLLAPSRDHNGNRVYDEISIVRARNIKQLIEVGLTSKDVAQYLDNGCLDRPLSESPRCAGELATARARLSSVDEHIARLQSLRERLAAHHHDLAAAIDPEGDAMGSELTRYDDRVATGT